MSAHYLTSTAHLPVHERLYSTGIGFTKGEKKAAVPARPSTAFDARESRAGYGAAPRSSAGAPPVAVKHIPSAEGGLLIVRYNSGRFEQKRDNKLTARGAARNAAGGFFSS
jgi:hypothetical protein